MSLQSFFFWWHVPTPQFYPHLARPLNMFRWMPRQERPTVACRNRHITRDASRRRGQPRVIAGSVSAGVNRRLGLARGRITDRICSHARVEHEGPVNGLLCSSSALLSPFYSLLSAQPHGRPSRPKKSGDEAGELRPLQVDCRMPLQRCPCAANKGSMVGKELSPGFNLPSRLWRQLTLAAAFRCQQSSDCSLRLLVVPGRAGTHCRHPRVLGVDASRGSRGYGVDWVAKRQEINELPSRTCTRMPNGIRVHTRFKRELSDCYLSL